MKTKVLHIIAILLIFLFQGNIVSSQTETINGLKSEIPNLEGEELVDAYLQIAKENIYIDPSVTIKNAELALKLAEELGNIEQIARSHIYLGNGLLFNGQFEPGIKEIDTAIDLSKKVSNPMLMCQGLNAKAVYFMNTGDYEQSLQLFNESLQLAIDNGFTSEVAMIQFNIGAVHTNQGESIKGLIKFKQALDFFKESGKKEIIARIFNNIAVNYHSWGNLDQALENYQNAAKIYEEINNPLGQVAAMNNIGEIFKDKKQYSKAIEYYEHSLEISKTRSNMVFRAVPMVGLAEVYLKSGEIENAEIYITQSYKIFKENNFKEGIARSRALAGELAYIRSDFKVANNYLNEALKLAQEIGIKELESDIYKLLSNVKKDENKFQQALNYAILHNAIEDSLLDIYKSKQLNDILAQMEISQRETEIGLLQKDNAIKDLEIKRRTLQSRFLYALLVLVFAFAIVVLYFSNQRKKSQQVVEGKNRQISEQHDQLVMANDMKNKFLSIIGHDLLSPVGAIRDVIIQLADYPEMFTEEERVAIITDMRLEADSTYFLLTNLLTWAKSQNEGESKNLEDFTLRKIVRYSIQLHKRNAESKSIKITSDIDPGLKVYCDQNMVGLVVRNLVSNAIKFTPEGGEVTIYTKEKDGVVEFCVKDTGIGISKQNQERLFSNEHISTYGTNKEKGTGLGLILCKDFVERNNGKLYLKETSEKGSIFCFTMQKSTS